MYYIVTERKFNEETGNFYNFYTVIDQDGYPQNYAHFTDVNDAEYILDLLESGRVNYNSAAADENCKLMSSQISI